MGVLTKDLTAASRLEPRLEPRNTPDQVRITSTNRRVPESPLGFGDPPRYFPSVTAVGRFPVARCTPLLGEGILGVYTNVYKNT